MLTEKQLRYKRRWNKKNPDKIAEYNRRAKKKREEGGYKIEYTPEIYKKNKEAMDRAHKKYVEKNRKKINDYTNNYLKERKGLYPKTPLTPEQIEKKKLRAKERNATPEKKEQRRLRYLAIKDTPEFQEYVKRNRAQLKEKRKKDKMIRMLKKAQSITPIIISEDYMRNHNIDLETLLTFLNSTQNSNKEAGDNQIQ